MSRTVEVVLHLEADRLITRAARASHPLETGGLLLGWYQGEAVIIRHAAEVIDPCATGNSWQRERASAQAALTAALAHHQHPWLGYVGDWHSHPLPIGPSPQDIRSITRASRALDGPAVLLVHRPGDALDVVVARRGRVQDANLTYPNPAPPSHRSAR